MSGVVLDRCQGDSLFLCSHCVLNSPRSCPDQQPQPAGSSSGGVS